MRNGWLVTARQPVGLLRGELDGVLDEVFGEFLPELRTRPASWAPTLDVSDGEEEITVRAEIPGMDPEDFDISVSHGVLSISGEKKGESQEQRENFYRKERRFGSFCRSILLPDSVEAEKTSAEYDKGVLTIRLAKKEKAVPKKIPVMQK
ncbi:MAG: Hsp20/alpha crystallin family protein [Gemmatimonadota bacterium]|jgi:HSP20 family protein